MKHFSFILILITSMLGTAWSATPQESIEKFMSQVALNMIEVEWSIAYNNKIPTGQDKLNAMLGGDLEACPEDFQEAWRKQIQYPERNYTASMFRKYDIKLATVRQKLQADLFRIDPTVHPPIPLYDEGETPPKLNPTTCGSQKAILAAIQKLRAKISGVDPVQAAAWNKAIERTMYAFALNYIETTACMNAAGITQEEVATMFSAIPTEGCPQDFTQAWQHDLPYFQQAKFADPALQTPRMCIKYSCNLDAMFKAIQHQMDQWNIPQPTPATQTAFREQFRDLKAAMLDYR